MCTRYIVQSLIRGHRIKEAKHIPFVGWSVEGVEYTVEEALYVAKLAGNFEGFPAHVLKALIPQERSSDILSPSSATDCPRQKILKWEHPYYEKMDRKNPHRHLAPLFGTAFHKALEDPDSEWSERRLEIPLEFEIDGKKVVIIASGQMDHYLEETFSVWDTKTTKEFMTYDPETKGRKAKTFPEPRHIIQLNIYAYLIRDAGYDVKAANIYYVRRDGTNHRIVPVELWDHETVFDLMYTLAKPLAEYQATGTLPPVLTPEDEGFWQCNYCPVSELCADLALGDLEIDE